MAILIDTDAKLSEHLRELRQLLEQLPQPPSEGALPDVTGIGMPKEGTLPSYMKVHMGSASLLAPVYPILCRVAEIVDQGLSSKNYLKNGTAAHIDDQLDRLLSELKKTGKLSDPEFLGARDDVLSVIRAHYRSILECEPDIILSMLAKSGLHAELDSIAELRKTVAETKKQLETVADNSKAAIGQAQSQLQAKLEQMKTSADQYAATTIERARRTAAGISVEGAQVQFSEACQELERPIYLWASLTLVSLLGVAGVFWWLLAHPAIAGYESWAIVYAAATRVTLLGFLSAVVAYCGSMLRAYLHLKQTYQHRLRVANSLQAFVEAAGPEQRDAILLRLVGSIVELPDTGLLKASAQVPTAQNIIVDSLAGARGPTKFGPQ